MNIMIAGQQLTMSSREIAELVESRHADVVRSIDRLMDSGVIGRYTPAPYTHPQNGQQYMTYNVGKRDTYVIVAQLSPAFTARLVDRWQELEAGAAPAVPQTMAQALRLAADQAEQIEQQEKALALAAPKVEFVDRYVESTGLKGFREVAKLLKANEARFSEFLEDSKVMYRLSGKLMPYQNHIEAGRFEVRTGVAENEHAFTSAKFTPKGVAWIAGEWAKHQLKSAV